MLLLLSAAGLLVCSGSGFQLSGGLPPTGILQQVAPLHSVAVLPCPHAGEDVTWSRFQNGARLVLVTITEGRETRLDPRFGSQADGSLVIIRTEASDETVYVCNQKHRVYLTVASDPQQIPSKAPPEPGPRGGDPEDPRGGSAEIQQASGWWKVPAGVVTGAALVLLSVFILRFCSAKRAEETDGRDRSLPDVVYEEIRLNTGPLCRSQPAGGNPAGATTRIYDPNPEEMSTKENEIYSSDP